MPVELHLALDDSPRNTILIAIHTPARTTSKQAETGTMLSIVLDRLCAVLYTGDYDLFRPLWGLGFNLDSQIPRPDFQLGTLF